MTQNSKHLGAKVPGWFKSDAEIAQLLGNRLAQAAIKGKSLPVCELVLARIEGSK